MIIKLYLVELTKFQDHRESNYKSYMPLQWWSKYIRHRL